MTAYFQIFEVLFHKTIFLLSCVPMVLSVASLDESGRAERQAAARHPEGWRLFHKVVSRKPSALAQRKYQDFSIVIF
jgi:hypothetical protein